MITNFLRRKEKFFVFGFDNRNLKKKKSKKKNQFWQILKAQRDKMKQRRKIYYLYLHKYEYFTKVYHKFDINYVICSVTIIFQLSKYSIKSIFLYCWGLCRIFGTDNNRWKCSWNRIIFFFPNFNISSIHSISIF